MKGKTTRALGITALPLTKDAFTAGVRRRGKESRRGVDRKRNY